MSEPEQLFSGDYGWVRLTPGPEGQMLLSYVRWLEWSRSRRVESRIVGTLGEGVVIDPPEDDTPESDDVDMDATGDPTDDPELASDDEATEAPSGQTEDPDDVTAGGDDEDPAADTEASETSTPGEPSIDEEESGEAAPSGATDELGGSGDEAASDAGDGSLLCGVHAPGRRSDTSLGYLALLALVGLRRNDRRRRNSTRSRVP